MKATLQQRLRSLRQAVRTQIDTMDADDTLRQFHPELSPMAWHVGHSFFTEAYWVAEVVGGDDGLTAAWKSLYIPEYSNKTERGLKLPRPPELIAWTQQLETGIEAAWQRATASNAATQHTLLAGNYLAFFLIQHYAQHLETMAMVRQQAALACAHKLPTPAALRPQNDLPEFTYLPGGEIQIGGTGIDSYDNELPAHKQTVDAFSIAEKPVNNGQWLAFMQDGGYQRPELWQPAGRAWLRRSGTQHPQHWRAHPQGGWFCPDPAETLDSQAPVHGLCWHEAQAFATWAQARFPQEHEWEYAQRNQALPNSGHVWEWCANALYPYPGFRAFPYHGYSSPWFDGHHRVARGASRHTCAEIKRPSFRNFYPAGHRHVFAGLRLARD